MTSKVVLSEDSRNYDGIISIMDLLGKRGSHTSLLINKRVSIGCDASVAMMLRCMMNPKNLLQYERVDSIRSQAKRP